MTLTPEKIPEVLLITYCSDDEYEKWGLNFTNFNCPIQIYYAPKLQTHFDEKPQNDNLMLKVWNGKEDFQFLDVLQILNKSYADAHFDVDRYFYIDLSCMYKYFNFDLLYGGYYHNYLSILKEPLYFWKMLDLERPAVFGGAGGSIMNLNDHLNATISKHIVLKNEHFELPNIIFNNENIDLQVIQITEDKLLHIAGDSHVLYNFSSFHIAGNRSPIYEKTSPKALLNKGIGALLINHIGAVTMHGFANSELYSTQFFQKNRLKKGDWFLAVFGEIDCRNHIVKIAKTQNQSFEEVIEQLCSRYMKKLIDLNTEFELEQLMVYGANPPLDISRFPKNNLETEGTIAERVEVTKILHSKLKQKCEENKFIYFDGFDLYAMPNGELDPEKSDLFCHINPYMNDLIKERLYNTIANA